MIDLAMVLVAVTAAAALLYSATRLAWRVLVITVELGAYVAVCAALATIVYYCAITVDTATLLSQAARAVRLAMSPLEAILARDFTYWVSDGVEELLVFVDTIRCNPNVLLGKMWEEIWRAPPV